MKTLMEAIKFRTRQWREAGISSKVVDEIVGSEAVTIKVIAKKLDNVSLDGPSCMQLLELLADTGSIIATRCIVNEIGRERCDQYHCARLLWRMPPRTALGLLLEFIETTRNHTSLCAAAYAMSGIMDSGFVPIMICIMSDECFPLRARELCAESIGMALLDVERGPSVRWAGEALLTLLASDEPDMRVAACRGLSDLRYGPAQDRMGSLVDDYSVSSTGATVSGAALLGLTYFCPPFPPGQHVWWP